MTALPFPPAEARRAGLLRDLGLDRLQGVAELDAAVRLAADVAHAPMAMLCVADETRLHLLARHGLAPRSVALEGSFCAEAMHGEQPLVVADAWLDARFAAHDLVQGEARVRSGVALVLHVNGLALATLCVFDRRAREYDAGQLGALADLAALAAFWFEARCAALDAQHERACGRALVLRLGEALRPQLEAISGHGQVLMLDAEAALAPRALRHLDKVRRTAQRVNKLFEDLARLIRAQSPQGEPVHTMAHSNNVDLDVVARHAIVLHEAQARQAGVELRHVAWPEPVLAAADLSAVLQVIAELLGNGIAFNLRDATLTLETSVRAQWACLSFTDEGLGIDAHQRARLFDPLQRHPMGAADESERSGLGLLIARAMACAMGGDIRVESKPGAGCTFTLELPLHPASPAATGAPRGQDPTPDQHAAST